MPAAATTKTPCEAAHLRVASSCWLRITPPPEYFQIALAIYRREFQPSPALAKPYVMIGVGVFAADTDAEARRLFTSAQMQFLNLVRGRPGELPPPVESLDGQWSHAEQAAVEERTRCSAVGAAGTVRHRLKELIEETGADEVIATAQIFDHAARLHSFEIAANAFAEINAASKEC